MRDLWRLWRERKNPFYRLAWKLAERQYGTDQGCLKRIGRVILWVMLVAAFGAMVASFGVVFATPTLDNTAFLGDFGAVLWMMALIYFFGITSISTRMSVANLARGETRYWNNIKLTGVSAWTLLTGVWLGISQALSQRLNMTIFIRLGALLALGVGAVPQRSAQFSPVTSRITRASMEPPTILLHMMMVMVFVLIITRLNALLSIALSVAGGTLARKSGNSVPGLLRLGMLAIVAGIFFGIFVTTVPGTEAYSNSSLFSNLGNDVNILFLLWAITMFDGGFVLSNLTIIATAGETGLLLAAMLGSIAVYSVLIYVSLWLGVRFARLRGMSA